MAPNIGHNVSLQKNWVILTRNPYWHHIIGILSNQMTLFEIPHQYRQFGTNIGGNNEKWISLHCFNTAGIFCSF